MPRFEVFLKPIEIEAEDEQAAMEKVDAGILSSLDVYIDCAEEVGEDDS